MIDRDKLFEEKVVANSHGQTIEELADALDEAGDLQAKYAAVCAELESVNDELSATGLALAIAKNELEKMQNSLPKIKADAVREAVNDVVQNLMMYNGTDLDVECTDDLLRYADKLEKGE